jgi:hypothetical protein
VTTIPLAEYRQKQAGRPDWIDSEMLLAKVFPPLNWVVQDLIPEGLTVLAGRQKTGKSRLALAIATSVATGGVAFGEVEVQQGDVLYLDLENGEARVQRRMVEMYLNSERPNLARLSWSNKAVRIDNGLMDVLEHWRLSVPHPRLIVIDVLQRVKPAGIGTRTAYENDYAAWGPLQAWATEHGIAVLGLHHTRKAFAEDPLETLSGSNGLGACADTTIVLTQRAGKTSLYVRGRDVEEQEIALTSEDGQLRFSDEALGLGVDGDQGLILGVLFKIGGGLRISAIEESTGIPNSRLRKTLSRMCNAGLIDRAGYGLYAAPQPPIRE